MTALVSWGGDAMPAGVSISPPADSHTYCTPQRAAEIDARLRAAAGRLHAEALTTIEVLREARLNNIHQHYGMLWHEYVADVFEDFRNLRFNGDELAVEERRHLHASLADENLAVRGNASYRSIRELTGYSLGTIRADLVQTGRAEPSKVVDLEPEPAPVTYEGMTRTRETLARVAAQDARGLTSIELDEETGWPMGTATANLSKLERRGLVARVAAFRRNRAAYVITETGRATLEQ